MFARVAFNLPLDRTFQYAAGDLIGEGLAVGDLVAAPFGHRRRDQVGCVIALDERLEEGLDPAKVKPLSRRATPGYRISEELLDLARWIAQHYVCTWGEALACISLVGFNDVGRLEERWLSLADPDASPKLTPKQRLVAEYLREMDNAPRTAADLAAICGVSTAVLKNMIRDGALLEQRRAPHRPDPYDRTPAPDTAPTLTDEQSAALDAIRASLDAARMETHLLHGVTGSGKTEVYLRALEHALGLGRQAIILVPEIALTPQTVGRFRARFGERIGVIHSRLNLGQKLALWRRIERGEIDAVIGARSAVFAPLERLGLIVVDEEHEGTYKQASPAPRYHARDVAVVRAQRLGATVILGSATPSLESHHNCKRRKYQRLILSRRVGEAELPRVEVIDMARETADATDPSPLSRPLRDALATRLERGEQSIVLLNRRGFSAFVRCGGCGKVLRCDHCDVAQTWHRRRGLLVCHWCESARRMPPACPECESENLIPVGLGTQRIEEVLEAEFPGARLRRIDLDTTRGKDAFLVHWREISEGRVDIILGTQMIAKGLDLPRVTLVGVISADQTLFLPDFRASERAFQLLTQVAGRAGRADLPGEVLIQTFVPHHWAIRCAIEHDFEAFFTKEMRMRSLLRYPPAQRMASMLFSGEQEASVSAAAKRMGEICDTVRHLDEMRETLTTIGPAPAPIARISDRWRWRLLLRSSSAHALHRALALAREEYARRSPPRGVQLAIDVDPMDLL